ncbi:circadian clock KaiB family protein [Actinopolymorpha pittospori]
MSTNTGEDRGPEVTLPPLPSFSLRLFVSGDTELSVAAETRLRSLCERRLPGGYQLEVIDVSEHPELADEDQIVVIPTVVRLAPIPQRRVMGDLSDDVRTAAALGLPDPDQVVFGRGRE